MATTRRRKSAALIQQLLQAPEKFDLLQAVRLLEQSAIAYNKHNTSSKNRSGNNNLSNNNNRPRFATIPVAHQAPPNREVVRFKSQPSLAFQGHDIVTISTVPTTDADDIDAPDQQWEVLLAIFGLFGNTGVLPYHDSELVINRLRMKDHSLRDFLDIFNHRSASLYFRSLHKYKLPFAYESNRAHKKNETDIFTHINASLLGIGTNALQNRQPIADESLMGYTGLLSGRPPSAPVLEGIIAHYVQMPVKIEQFIAQQQALPEDLRTRLPDRKNPRGFNNTLGNNALLGKFSWHIQSKFRVCFHDLDYEQFLTLSPKSDKLNKLKSLIRFAVGIEYDFEISISISERKLPLLGLGATDPLHGINEMLLGWSSLIRSDSTQAKKDNLIELKIAG